MSEDIQKLFLISRLKGEKWTFLKAKKSNNILIHNLRLDKNLLLNLKRNRITGSGLTAMLNINLRSKSLINANATIFQF